MIGLRRRIERGLRHPVFGPLLLVVLLALVVFGALNGASDTLAGAPPLVCVAIVVVLLSALLATRELLVTRCVAAGRQVPRGPPRPTLWSSPSMRGATFHPLRL